VSAFGNQKVTNDARRVGAKTRARPRIAARYEHQAYCELWIRRSVTKSAFLMPVSAHKFVKDHWFVDVFTYPRRIQTRTY
jgi:hypothetical protein